MIEWQVLPPELAKLWGAEGFWKHSVGNDIMCYPEDPLERAMAEPTRSRLR